MALTKRLYKNHQTVITAENMNDIQDSILALEQMAGIVPGEGETTKIINVINPTGTLTAAQAAAHPDGLYWVVYPVTFQDETQAKTLQLKGLAAKTDTTWMSYDAGMEFTTDENGVLISWRSLSPRITRVEVDAASDSYTLELTDGSIINGSGTFDENGEPTSLADDAGNSVTFSMGDPIGATDGEGNTVDITVLGV